MPDKSAPTDVKSDAATPTAPAPPRRGPGHRGAEVKDTVAEMAAKAHEISLEAGSKMAAAMKDVINAAAGLTGFVLESARDLVQYMVRRGQMTQEEADKLIRQAEDAQASQPVAPHPKVSSAKAAAPDAQGAVIKPDVASKKIPAVKAVERPTAKKATPAAKAPTEKTPVAKTPAAKQSAAKKATPKKK